MKIADLKKTPSDASQEARELSNYQSGFVHVEAMAEGVRVACIVPAEGVITHGHFSGKTASSFRYMFVGPLADEHAADFLASLGVEELSHKWPHWHGWCPRLGNVKGHDSTIYVVDETGAVTPWNSGVFFEQSPDRSRKPSGVFLPPVEA